MDSPILPDSPSIPVTSDLHEDPRKNTKSLDKLWDEIGFHKPLAGFWFSLGFKLISMILTVIISGYLLNLFYPFPESTGYKSAATGIFSVFFTIMDLGTHMTMDRFIADSRIKDPKKMLGYIQWFIWYQMTTGLIQTTTVSLYALIYVPKSELSYAIWLMLICSTFQYPGFLGVFGGVLGALQQYNKTEILGFISGEVMQRITELSFVYIGRIWGAANPQYGEIMGIAIGSMIGGYVDDFFSTWLSAHFFNVAMKAEGLTAGNCFGHSFDWPMVKEVMVFGIKTGMPGLIGLVASLVMLWEFLLYVPQYTTFSTLSGLASGIMGLINTAAGAPTALIAESYLNQKYKLTNYYITQTIRYAALFQGFLIALVSSLILVLERAFIAFDMKNYILAIPFMLPWLVRHIQQPYTSLADNILLGTNHPNFLMWIRFLEEVMKVFFTTLFIVWLELPTKFGLDALVWIIPCGIYPAIMMKTIAIYVYVNKTIFKVHVIWWQSLGVPLLSGFTVYGFNYLIILLVLNPLDATYGFLVGAIVTIILFVVCMITFYFILTALLGGWDNESLNEFEKAARMSGPSKPLVWPMYWFTAKFCKISKLHNKFGLDPTEALQEAQELLALKHSHAVNSPSQ